jgi:hypothetical protein
VTASPIPEHDLESRVGQIDWFHRIDLCDGIVTLGSHDSPARLSALQLPSLKGKTVLDVGARDGFSRSPPNEPEQAESLPPTAQSGTTEPGVRRRTSSWRAGRSAPEWRTAS